VIVVIVIIVVVVVDIERTGCERRKERRITSIEVLDFERKCETKTANKDIDER
jgi:hypothetical protein